MPIVYHGPIERVTSKGLGLLAGPVTPCYVPWVCEGDQVAVKVVKQTPHYHIAHPTRVHHASPHRVVPMCHHYTRCGGCQLMHADLSYQRQLKTNWLFESLSSHGLSVPASTVKPMLWSDDTVSRRQLRLVATPQGDWGINRRHSALIEPITHCSVIPPELNHCLAVLSQWRPCPPAQMAQATATFWVMDDTCLGRVMGIPVTESEAGAIHDQMGLGGSFWQGDAAHPGITLGNPVAMVQVDGISFRVGLGSFFQGHPSLMTPLLRAVMVPEVPHTVWDLYAGVGVFGRHALARGAQSVTLVEDNPVAARDAQFNCEGHPMIQADVAHAMAAMTDPPDWVIADPPRTGLSLAVHGQLMRWCPPQLTLVHCQLDSMGRDVSRLVANGYRIAHIQPLDLFPHTIHMEVVTQLVWPHSVV